MSVRASKWFLQRFEFLRSKLIINVTYRQSYNKNRVPITGNPIPKVSIFFPWIIFLNPHLFYSSNYCRGKLQELQDKDSLMICEAEPSCNAPSNRSAASFGIPGVTWAWISSVVVIVECPNCCRESLLPGLRLWGERRDSNPRSPGPQPGALNHSATPTMTGSSLPFKQSAL